MVLAVARKTSPTQRSLAFLRKQGWTAEVVERWIPRANVRKDLFGIIDIVALRGNVTLGVQATSASNVSARIRKIADAENIGVVRDAGWQIEVHGWVKRANGRWDVRVEDVS